MGNAFSESDILAQVMFLAIDIRESDFRGTEAFGQMLLRELKLGHKKIRASDNFPFK
jgi:hypothetical protein